MLIGKNKMIFTKTRLIAIGIIAALVIGLAWLLTTDNPAIWPIRNTLQYHALRWWWAQVGEPQPGGPGTLRGTVRDEGGQPIAGAWVLLSRWDGTTYSTRSDPSGDYLIPDVPAGTYRPVSGAPGFKDVSPGRVGLEAGAETIAEMVLPAAEPRIVAPGANLRLGEPTQLTCATPLDASGLRREVTLDSAGQPNQPTFYYTPVTATTTSQLPLLLAIYPGPADSWECASLPLAKAGYGVLAAGPAYSFDLEQDVDELVRLLDFARQGHFPGSDPTRIAALGGSYSGLHVQQLLQRGQSLQGALLLGPPSDLFDMRRRLENGTYIPPFGLDQALIALGLPSQEPLRYWRYSGAYHVRSDFPPVALLHSRDDDVVPYQQSELLATSLDAARVPHTTFFFDGASHYLLAEGEDETTKAIYRFTLGFLAEYLE